MHWKCKKEINKIKSNVIMQGINFNQRPTSIARRIPRATLIRGDTRSVGSIRAGSLWFLQHSVLGVCCSVSVLRSPLELSIMPSSGVTSPISVPCRQLYLGVQYYQWSKVKIRGQPTYHIQWIGSQGWGHLRANPRFEVFWFIPSLLSESIFGQPPLYEGFSPVCTRGSQVWVLAARRC